MSSNKVTLFISYAESLMKAEIPRNHGSKERNVVDYLPVDRFHRENRGQ